MIASVLLRMNCSERMDISRSTLSHRSINPIYCWRLYATFIINHNSISHSTWLIFFIQGYAHCPLWGQLKKVLKRNSNSEIAKFKSSAIFLDMIDCINARSGFKGSLQFDQIETIYELCRYEKAWDPKKQSIWCSVGNFLIQLSGDYRK